MAASVLATLEEASISQTPRSPSDGNNGSSVIDKGREIGNSEKREFSLSNMTTPVLPLPFRNTDGARQLF